MICGDQKSVFSVYCSGEGNALPSEPLGPPHLCILMGRVSEQKDIKLPPILLSFNFPKSSLSFFKTPLKKFVLTFTERKFLLCTALCTALCSPLESSCFLAPKWAFACRFLGGERSESCWYLLFVESDGWEGPSPLWDAVLLGGLSAALLLLALGSSKSGES